ncbi:hypothetical protein ElyMa_002216300 [Elysia marginata]|uniref:Uncharacterized protein n=1 Tax=Elysia marginata TaxID=1093978 RepID=A0AAV4FUW7_9GAST|nr:hypothetical protein ElyMa_002216300 [Elysia marginata]
MISAITAAPGMLKNHVSRAVDSTAPVGAMPSSSLLQAQIPYVVARQRKDNNIEACLPVGAFGVCRYCYCCGKQDSPGTLLASTLLRALAEPVANHNWDFRCLSWDTLSDKMLRHGQPLGLLPFLAAL